MFLDGVNIGAKFTTLPGNTVFCYANIGVPFGVRNASGVFNAHTITSTGQGFLAYINGEGVESAYSYSVGVNGKYTQNNTTHQDSITVTPGQCFTVGQIEQFVPAAASTAQSFSWAFGDGGTSTLTTPTHTYATAGTKTVSLTLNYACWSKTVTYTLNVCPVIILPVELLDFTAKNEKGQVVRLAWTSTSEINSDYYGIERSVDGVSFSEIGKSKGAGNSNAVMKYSFDDHQPLVGKNYYRLKQVNFTGKQDISAIANMDILNSALRVELAETCSCQR